MGGGGGPSASAGVEKPRAAAIRIGTICVHSVWWKKISRPFGIVCLENVKSPRTRINAEFSGLVRPVVEMESR